MSAPETGKAPRKGFWVLLLLAFFALTVFLGVIVEGFLRLASAPLINRPDAVLGWRVKENLATELRQQTFGGQAFNLHYETGPHGERHYRALPPDGIPAKKDPISILVLGDSFTMLPTSRIEQSWFAIFAQALAAKAQRAVEVTALGASAYGTLQERLLATEAKRRGAAPNIIILQTCINDFYDNSYALESQTLYREQYLRRPFATADQPDGVFYAPGFWGWLYRSPLFRLRLSSTFNRAWHKLDLAMMAPDQALSPQDARLVHLKRLMPERPDLTPQAVAITLAQMSAIRALFPQATALSLTCSALDYLTPLNARWPEISAKAGFVFLSGVPQAVEQASETDPDVYTEDRIHWAPRGNQIAGQRAFEAARDALAPVLDP